MGGVIYLIGAITVHYKLFPYPQLVELKQSFTKNTYSTNQEYIRLTDSYKIYDSKADIVMLGDSITFGINWNELFNMNIINRGIGSDTTEGFLSRIENIYSTNPKKVFIMGGINDLSRGVKVNQIFSNYIKIVEALKSKNIVPYIQSTLYTNTSTRNYLNPNVTELNTLLKEYSIKNNITYIDLNEKLSKNNSLISDYTYDGVHLNSNGYKIWKKEIEQYITTSINQ